MRFDQPAIIQECDGCGKSHRSPEEWVSCLITALQNSRAEIKRLIMSRTEPGRTANSLPASRGGAVEARRKGKGK